MAQESQETEQHTSLRKIGLMGKNAAYAAQYAEEAKEQMRMYGIPASVILAQAYWRAATDRANCRANATIHFGIKATASC